MADLLIYALPAPHLGARRVAQRNAIQSWKALGADVLLFGHEEGLSQLAGEIRAPIYPVARAEEHPRRLPYLHDAVEQAEALSNGTLCYVNADIILLPGFADAVRRTQKKHKRFLFVARRWDVVIEKEIVFDDGWSERLRREAHNRGELHRPTACDVFCYRGIRFGGDMPPFLVGVPRYDNWFIWKALKEDVPVIDATPLGPLVIHSDHDRVVHSRQAEADIEQATELLRGVTGERGLRTFAHAVWRLSVDGFKLTHYGRTRGWK